MTLLIIALCIYAAGFLTRDIMREIERDELEMEILRLRSGR